MPKVRTLAPLTHPTTGEQFGQDTVVDVADDVAAEWRAAGKVSLISDEERNEKAATHFSDVVGREEVGQHEAQPEEEEDERSHRKGKK